LAVFNAAVAAHLLPLAIIGIAASVIGAFYYLKIVKLMYFDEANDSIVSDGDNTLPIIGGALALAVSPLGYLAIPLLASVTNQAAKALF
jgi:NADH-quinone oxidoreductase subunit N